MVFVQWRIPVKSELSDSTFAIGAVARLTGIPMDTLRIWERRYRAVVPQRSSQNRRFYSRDDVTRLLLIKQLVELGEPVSTVVHLKEMQLRKRLNAQAELQQAGSPVPAPIQRGGNAARVLVFGDVLPYQMRYWSTELQPLDLVGGYNLFNEFEQAVLKYHPEILLLEFPALQAKAVSRVQELMLKAQSQRVIVIYAFATRPLLEGLRKLGVMTLRVPVTPAVLLEACQPPDHQSRPETDFGTHITDIAPRRFSGKQLAMIGGVPSRLVCECPQHLVDLVSRVAAFEQYSLDCELRTSKDAAIHERLHRMTAHARATLESALSYLLESEQIEIPDYEDTEPVTEVTL
jgi:DNA-binding transcriptional MerR regulator